MNELQILFWGINAAIFFIIAVPICKSWKNV